MVVGDDLVQMIHTPRSERQLLASCLDLSIGSASFYWLLDKRIVSKAKNRLCRESKLLEWLGIAKLLVFGVNPVFFYSYASSPRCEFSNSWGWMVWTERQGAHSKGEALCLERLKWSSSLPCLKIPCLYRHRVPTIVVMSVMQVGIFPSLVQITWPPGVPVSLDST